VISCLLREFSDGFNYAFALNDSQIISDVPHASKLPKAQTNAGIYLNTHGKGKLERKQ
jgi:hypothetical protein